MLDGREPDLQTQALHAIQRHFQVRFPPPASDLLHISQFELTEPFYSSNALRKFARGGKAPTLPEGKTPSEIRGRIFFEDAPLTGPDFKKGACAVCHSGPMLNQTNQFFENLPGLRFLSVAVSEFNAARNRSRPFIFRKPDGTSVTVSSPDPGRALITGVPFVSGPPFLSDFNAFKISVYGVSRIRPRISTTIRRRRWRTWPTTTRSSCSYACPGEAHAAGQERYRGVPEIALGVLCDSCLPFS